MTGMKLPAIVCIVLAVSALHAADSPRIFKAGAATSNVTPELGSSINGGFQDGKATFIQIPVVKTSPLVP